MPLKIMPHGRLQEWVAEEKGLLTAEGLDYTFLTDSGDYGNPLRPAATTRRGQDRGALETSGRAATAPDVSCPATGHNDRGGGAVRPARGRAATAVAPCADRGAARIRPVRRPRGPGPGCRSAWLPLGRPFRHRARRWRAFSGPDEPEAHLPGTPNDAARRAAARDVQAAPRGGVPIYGSGGLTGFRKVVDATFMMGFLVTRVARPARNDID